VDDNTFDIPNWNKYGYGAPIYDESYHPMLSVKEVDDILIDENMLFSETIKYVLYP
jgi:hypothetical protein